MPESGMLLLLLLLGRVAAIVGGCHFMGMVGPLVRRRRWLWLVRKGHLHLHLRLHLHGQLHRHRWVVHRIGSVAVGRSLLGVVLLIARASSPSTSPSSALPKWSSRRPGAPPTLIDVVSRQRRRILLL